MTAVRETRCSDEPSGASNVPDVAALPTPSWAIHVARPFDENASVGLSTNSCAVDTLTGGDHWADAGVAATRKATIVSSARMVVETHGRAWLLRRPNGNCPVRGCGRKLP